MLRERGCRDCEKTTSGDCGKHGAQFYSVSYALPGTKSLPERPTTAAEWCPEIIRWECGSFHSSDCVTCKALDAYARQQVEAVLEKLANYTAKGFTGCVVCKYVSEAGHREDCLLAAAIRALSAQSRKDP